MITLKINTKIEILRLSVGVRNTKSEMLSYAFMQRLKVKYLKKKW